MLLNVNLSSLRSRYNSYNKILSRNSQKLKTFPKFHCIKKISNDNLQQNKNNTIIYLRTFTNFVFIIYFLKNSHKNVNLSCMKGCLFIEFEVVIAILIYILLIKVNNKYIVNTRISLSSLLMDLTIFISLALLINFKTFDFLFQLFFFLFLLFIHLFKISYQIKILEYLIIPHKLKKRIRILIENLFGIFYFISFLYFYKRKKNIFIKNNILNFENLIFVNNLNSFGIFQKYISDQNYYSFLFVIIILSFLYNLAFFDNFNKSYEKNLSSNNFIYNHSAVMNKNNENHLSNFIIKEKEILKKNEKKKIIEWKIMSKGIKTPSNITVWNSNYLKKKRKWYEIL
ncbi:hypothetical protein (nucleomorph) [Guillardia theta]|uniref:Uncharacterized protein n=1 Tax=Guillardia theta TaxID=55529 RepID=Q98RZ1_GUITH|nr:hypothetical protein GTHECHR1017 [Guillardia theta]AAK39809.1 hypothetical protein [Guillardia theta]|mmetsp:Transcript_4019/g.14924  ORF Transcript_4019/g.14924 Transcript_4019/m.14924 type:complete len:342 (-) Transcript_4019:2250-3275(-)